MGGNNSSWYIANLNKHISGFLVIVPPTPSEWYVKREYNERGEVEC